MLQFCHDNNLKIANSFFPPPIGFGSGTFASSILPDQFNTTLDFILVPRSIFQNVRDCQVDVLFPGVDSADHRSVQMTIDLYSVNNNNDTNNNQRRNPPRSRKRKLDFSVLHSSDSDIRNRLEASLESSFMSFTSLDLAMPITDRLEILFQKRQQACDLVLPSLNNPTKKNQHWFDVNNHEIASLLKRKRHSYQAYMNNINNQWFKQQYQVAKAQTRKAIREMKTNFFTERADRIQELFEIGDMRGYYAALKETFGNAVSPYSNGRQSQLNTLRNKDGTIVYTSHRDRLDRLLEHLKALLNQESTVSEDIQARLPSQQPIITTIGNHFTRTELKVALSKLVNNKAPPWL